jgi:hypothetical protein
MVDLSSSFSGTVYQAGYGTSIAQYIHPSLGLFSSVLFDEPRWKYPLVNVYINYGKIHYFSWEKINNYGKIHHFSWEKITNYTW